MSDRSDSDGGAAAAVDLLDWDEWQDDPEEEDNTRSLFSDTVLPSPEACFAYDAEKHSFDIRVFRAQLDLDDYDTIRLINYIRREVAAGVNPLAVLQAEAQKGPGSGPHPWSSDNYLAPFLEDDPLLGYDYDEHAADEGWSAAAAAGAAALPGHPLAGTGGAGPSSSSGPSADVSTADTVAALKAENAALRARLAAVMEAALPEELLAEALKGGLDLGTGGPGVSGSRSGDDEAPRAEGGDEAGAASSSGRQEQATSGRLVGVVVPGKQGPKGSGGPGGNSTTDRIDRAYFESYSYFDIHREMLGDKARTQAYRDAFESNPSLLKGARVLDVGCGTGILSMFAARGGASSVVGLDASERIAGFARQIVASNGLSRESGGPVSIVNGRVEEVKDIGMEQVDVIVSEWMGYALLFETMLDSVLAARDRWLRPGGAVLPDIASIVVAGAGDGAMGLDFWEDVYGFAMRPIANELRSGAAGKVVVREVSASHLVTGPATIHRMDMSTMSSADQDFTSEFVLRAPAADEGAGAAAASSSGASTGPCVCSCIVLWFDVEFSERFCKERPVMLSTSPSAEMTHWMQAVLPLKAPAELPPGGGLACRISMARSKAQHRMLDLSLEYGVVGAVGAAAGAAPAEGQQPSALREAVSFSMEVVGE